MSLEVDEHADRRLAAMGPIVGAEAVAASILASDDAFARPSVHAKYLSAHMPLP